MVFCLFLSPPHLQKHLVLLEVLVLQNITCRSSFLVIYHHPQNLQRILWNAHKILLESYWKLLFKQNLSMVWQLNNRRPIVFIRTSQEIGNPDYLLKLVPCCEQRDSCKKFGKDTSQTPNINTCIVSPVSKKHFRSFIPFGKSFQVEFSFGLLLGDFYS